MKHRLIPCLILGMLTVTALLSAGENKADKPRIWVVTDLLQGPAGDEDDDVCMGVLLRLADHYAIEGISVNGSPQLVEGTDTWAKETFVADYKEEVGRLNAFYGNRYQLEVPVWMASTAGKRFKDIHAQAAEPEYLVRNPALKAIVEAADRGPLYVLNWGPLTEVAMLIKHCVDQGKTDTLKNITIISHWTQRNGPWNCAADNDACNHVHGQAESDKRVVMYELGPSGQQGLVENVCGSEHKLDPEIMLASRIGRHLDAKWTTGCQKCNGMADMSDAATLLVLIGFGGGLEAYEKNGTVADQNRVNRLLCQDRSGIFAKLHERALVASGKLKR